MMRRLVLAGVLALASALPAQAAGVANTSYVEPSGDRVLQLSIEIAAPPAAVWKAFVDAETIRRMGVPLAQVNLRAGGDIEEGFNAETAPGSGKSIHHRIVGYLPERLLVLQNISTPPGVPGGQMYPKIVQIVQIEPTAAGAKVILSGAGYGPDPEFGKLYAFFAEHNPEFLEQLKRFAETPAR